MTTAFQDRADADRMGFRAEIETFGAVVRSYDADGGLTVAVPVDGENPLDDVCQRHALTVREFFQFPLGTDQPSENLRHKSWRYHRQGDLPSCWLFAKLTPNGM